MYKAVIVDDEVDIRSRLMSMFKKINSDFEIIAEYENGSDAYEGISSVIPDLLITDIRIPYINGIELIRKVRSIAPLLRVIIITGYDEFDYAKEAIDLGVMGFIMKPITAEELIPVLQKAKDSLDSEYKLNENLISLKEYYENNRPLIRENDLCRLISMSEVSTSFENKLKQDGIELNYEQILMGVFDFDVSIDNVAPDLIEVVLLSMKKELIKVFSPLYSTDVFQRNDKLIVLLKSHNPFEIQFLEKQLQAIIYKTYRMTDVGISVGFSRVNVSTPSRDFKRMYNHALKALEYRTIIGGNQVLFYDNISPLPTKSKVIDETEYKQLIYNINYGTNEEVDEELQRLVILNKKDCYNASFSLNMMNILHAIMKGCSDLNLFYQKHHDYNDMFAKIFTLKTTDEVLMYFKDIVGKVNDINAEQRTQRIRNSLQNALDYMQVHYCDYNLSLELLAEKVNLSISYLCALFKTEKNTTFVKYLTQLRMEKASELLKKDDWKIIDIAEYLGYNEPYYFSHCFKKYYGKSPKEYRNEND